MDNNTRIAIYGAGSIGCFVGGLLQSAGRRVTFLVRPWLAADLKQHGLSLSDLSGLSAHIEPNRLAVETSPGFLKDADLVLLTTKSGGTADAARAIAALAPAGVPVLSLQNGVENPDILRNHLAKDRVLAGIVEFNAVNQGRGRFHRGTSGDIIIEAGRPDVAHLLAVPGLEIKQSENIVSMQWGKLLMNLNNGLNALSGLPLRRQLEDREWRVLLARQIAEALRVLKAAGIRPEGAQKIPPSVVPHILRLPNVLFPLAARAMLRMDPGARSSMWEDLMRRRETEIGEFQGAILRLAQEHGLKAPVSSAVLHLVKEAEAAKAGPPGLSAGAIEGQARLEAA